MKRYFLTGLFLFLPLALTLLIVTFIFNLLTTPFSGVVEAIFDRYNVLTHGFWIFTEHQVRQIISQFLVLVFLFGFMILFGAVASNFLTGYFIRWGEFVIHRIPMVGGVYKTSKDIVNTLFQSKTSSFKQVVLVEFPHPGSYSVGFITKDNIEGLMHGNRLAVFMPTTPNPTSGFLMLVKRDDLIFLDMKVDEALKYVISCGVIVSDFKTITAKEAYTRLRDTEEQK